VGQDTLVSLAKGFRVIVPQPYEASGFPAPDYEPSQEDAKLVEDSEFRVVSCKPASHSGFTHFLDGSQRSWLVAYCGLYPVYYAHVNAAILARDELRQVRGPDQGRYREDKGLFGYLLSRLDAFDDLDRVFGVRDLDEQKNEAPDAVSELIKSKISSKRGCLEKELGERFADGVLLVDGGVGDKASVGDDRLLVGVVKSHRKQYFASPERAKLVLNMAPGERTSVFERGRGHKDEVDVYSWYLRLHRSDSQGPMWGIVRVEIPKHPDLLKRVDEISGWILAERAPLSLPDVRYHRLLYPIRRVEQYLKARQLSDAAIRGILGK
jgi:hypothetical protein